MPLFGGTKPPQHGSGGFLDDVRGVVQQIVHKVAQVAAPTARGTAFSLVFAVLMFLFLFAHSRIDRRDPKLANAPLLPNFLPFEPPTPGGSYDLSS